MPFFIPTAAAGNGLTLATFGRAGEIMGFFYPQIDYAQNIREAMPAIRLLGHDNRFLWCFDEGWRVAQSFEPGSNVLITRLAHRDLDLSLEISDSLPPNEHALFRRVVITKGPSVGPVQFVHYFRMAIGDTLDRNCICYYPKQNLAVQFLRDISVAIGATERFSCRCGSYKEPGNTHTKAAMAAGDFNGSELSIGRVDFAIGFEPIVPDRWQTTLVFAGGSSPETAMAAADRLTRTTFEDTVKAADRRVADELADAGTCPVPELADAFDRAVISLHDLYSQSQGTFIAAPEFDPGFELSGGYGYCWPRDAAVCALAVHRIGRTDMARRFFEWCAHTQMPSGHWYQRYWTTGSPASAWCVHDGKIQLDQTCAILHAGGQFVRLLAQDGESFRESFRPVAVAATRAILEYVDEKGLHRPSSDLWENSVGSFAYTQAGVIAALREADEVFALEPSRTGPAARTTMRDQLIKTFWQPDRQRWLRRITPEGQPDATLDSSAMGLIYPWEVLNLADPQDRTLALATLNGIAQDLRSDVKGGGAILRFAGESYMGGGPGCVNTLWLGLCRLMLARTTDNIDEKREQFNLAMDHFRVALANSSPTGQLPELIPKILFEYWAAPHAWACSLLIEAVVLLRTMVADRVAPFDAARARVRRRAPSH
jgi:glucoamylase